MKREDNNGVSITTGYNQAKPIQKQELISTEVNLKSDLEVPKKNGRDCGVFVIMLAKALMLQVKKTLDVSWGKLFDANDLESSGQNAIRVLIMSQLHAK